MKLLGLLSLFALVSTAQAAPAFCGAANSGYKIEVADSGRTATVTLDGEEVEFGHLNCDSLRSEDRLGEEAFLHCESPYVADAGYTATFRRTKDPLRSIVKLEEAWIGGTHHRATLVCVHSLNQN